MVSWSPVMFRSSEPVVVFTGVTSAVTVMASASVPTSSKSLPRSRVSPLSSMTSLRLICLNPGISTRTPYLPAGSDSSRKMPRSSDTAERVRAVAGSVAITIAPGTTPSPSTMIPVRMPF